MKITSINIESSFTKFIDSQEIKIPSDKKTNCIFIYGKNGSGKSSISKLFYTNNKYIEGKEYIDDLLQLKTKRAIKDLNVKINFNNNTSNIFTGNSIINPIKIPVFNQEYIDLKITYQEDFKNNKFQEKNLNYCVELQSKTKYLDKIKIGKIEQKCKEELEEKINKQIKDNIENLKKDTSTKDNNKNYSMFTIEKLKLINPQEKEVIDDLNKKRLEHIKYIQSLKDLNDSNKIHLNIDFLDLPSIEQDIINVNKSLTFNEDETKTKAAREILDSLSEEFRKWKLDGVSHITNDRCPFCGSDIKENELVNMYKDYVDSRINKMKTYLTSEINRFSNYKNNSKHSFELVKANAQYLDSIFKSNLYNQINSLENNLNLYLDKIVNILKQKSLDNYLFVDSSKSIDNVNVTELNDIQKLYSDLTKNINDINKKVDSSTSDKTRRNDDYFQNVAIYLTYESMKDDIKQLIDSENKIKQIIKELKPLKEEYEKELREKNILLKKMNDILDDFNISNYRVDEEFNLCLNGEKVSFCVDKLLSNGEKSIIAFSLFIAELELYYSENDKNIILIDDPISSVDYPNLYGIYNYINNIIEENPNSQFIISSHNTLFMNLFKFDYKKTATYLNLTEVNGKTKIIIDNENLDSIFLEKLKEIFKIYKTNTIDKKQKLYIHNYCRYVLETISRFEYPINDNESTSSKYYLNKIIDNISNNISDYDISKVALQSLMKIVNKGSHATIDEVHDGEHFEDNHYIESCKAIIKFIKKDYNGQFELLSTDYDRINQINNT